MLQDQVALAVPPRLGLRAWEWVVFVAQPLLLLAAALWSQIAQPDAFRLLWTESAGHKMLLWGLVFLAANAALLGVGSHLLSRWLESQPTPRRVLGGVLHVGCFAILFMPAVWVVTIGPSALAISRALAAM
jgi:hypothetical protein